MLARRFMEEKMTWSRLGPGVLLERFMIAALFCVQMGVLGALAVAILPFLSETIQNQLGRRNKGRTGEWTC